MEFRPCIDIHNGKVKQIVGATLKDSGNRAKENFVSEKNADYYANLYKNCGIKGGHIILLNNAASEYYEADRQQAFLALSAYPGGMQIGGGINAANAKEYIEAGASHVIVTSYVFHEGHIDYERLEKLSKTVTPEHLVLDVSCIEKDGEYYVVTDRWQKITDEIVNTALLDRLSQFCDEFLVHAVDVEGKNSGIEQKLTKRLGSYTKRPITYAGGVHSYEDIELIKELGNNQLNVTVGSALDLFGGPLSYLHIQEICSRE